jgi:hypothetical protein
MLTLPRNDELFFQKNKILEKADGAFRASGFVCDVSLDLAQGRTKEVFSAQRIICATKGELSALLPERKSYAIAPKKLDLKKSLKAVSLRNELRVLAALSAAASQVEH